MYRCDTTGSGGAPTILLSSRSSNVNKFTTDGTTLYFVVTQSAVGSIGKCPIEGCAATGPTVMVTGGAPRSLAVDSTYLYFVDAAAPSRLKRIPK